MRYLAVMLLHEEIALHLDSQNQDCFNASPENSVQSQHLSHENSVGLHIDSQHNRPGCNAAGDCCFNASPEISSESRHFSHENSIELERPQSTAAPAAAATAAAGLGVARAAVARAAAGFGGSLRGGSPLPLPRSRRGSGAGLEVGT